MAATVVAPAPALLTELTKARRMIALALRHDRTRRLVQLAVILYGVKRLARWLRRQRAADRFVREMLERERPASRVQSAVDLTAYSRQPASRIGLPRSASRAGLPRSASRAVLTSMVHKHAPGQALCEKCFSRCTSNASLATLADAADDEDELIHEGGRVPAAARRRVPARHRLRPRPPLGVEALQVREALLLQGFKTDKNYKWSCITHA